DRFEHCPEVPQLIAHYTEDLQVGYRWYEANGVAPLFPFGHGLSYTTFEYSDLSVTPGVGAAGQRLLTVAFTVRNTGDVAGAEATQVYLSLPAEAEEPGKRLVAFDKVHLAPGQGRQISVTIDAAASHHPFSY